MRTKTDEKLHGKEIGKRLFSAAEYHRMAETGILSEDDRVELIEGEVLTMAPIDSRHAACIGRFTEILSRLSDLDAIVWVQNPILLDERTEPEPDVALLSRRGDFYSGQHPVPTDVLMVIEVADTSIEYDRRVKLPLYAWSGLPEVWIVDLSAETIEIHSRPVTGEYREALLAKRGETLKSKTISGLELAVNEILG